jgi:TolB-like protein/tetratricopeptide (TPR) repeat protein
MAVDLRFARIFGLADVMTEELTTYLARIPDAFVIARSTAFTFKGKPIDIKRIGRELGVRYALEGSTQPSGNRVRVNAQLINTENGAHVWADRFDAARGELLDMQDEIVTRIARTLQVSLSAVAAARLQRAKPENPDAEALAVRAEALFLAYGISPREETKTFVRLCEDALDSDPRNPRALSILAPAISIGIWAGQLKLESDGRRAEDLIARALAIDPDQYLAHHARASLLMVRRQYDEAVVADERALDINPIYVGTYITLSLCHAFLGRPHDGLPYVEKAMRLSPRDPLTWSLLFNKAILHMMRGEDDQALEALSRQNAINSGFYGRGCFAAALALKGRIDEAREQLQRYLATTTAIPTIAAWKAREESSNPTYLAYRERLYEGLRKAGMPEG